MKNYVQEGSAIKVAALEDMVSGKPYVVGKLRGVASHDALTGEDCELVTDQVFELDKTVADVIAQGVQVNLNPTSGEITVANTVGNFAFGIATEAAGNGATVCKVKTVQDMSAAL